MEGREMIGNGGALAYSMLKLKESPTAWVSDHFQVTSEWSDSDCLVFFSEGWGA
jgi:hypothetical protein